MGLLRLLCMPCVSLLLFSTALAQTPARSGAPAQTWPKRAVRFLHEDPVLGLPPGMSRSSPRCAADGRTYFEVADEGSSPTGTPSLYSVTDSGETRLLPRKLPTGYTSVTVRDFYAADHTLVTLLQADKRNEADSTAPPREVRYFLSLSDHDGSGADLLPLDVRFRPTRVALFGTGDFLLLGWDDLNLMPVLALVKDTGDVRRFIDLHGQPSTNGQIAGTTDSSGSAGTQLTGMEEADLAKASFVPLGEEVLLTFPGTRKSFQVWNAAGESSTVPWSLPGGFVLHDVLASGQGPTLVVRVRPVVEAKADTKEKKDDASNSLPERLFEISSYHGSLLREFLTDKPAVAEVTCATKGTRLTAMFMDDMASQSPGSGAAVDTSKPQHLVISTALR